MLVLLGCLCYAVSNLGQEHLVKCFDRFEFLGMLGLCGSAVSAVQMAALEHEQLAQVQWRGETTVHARTKKKNESSGCALHPGIDAVVQRQTVHLIHV